MIVVLPGWNQSSEEWREIQSRFGAENLMVLDLPGFGKEPLASRNWGIPDYAGWVEKRIRDIGLERVILLGHSFGGRVACYLASKNPDWLGGLILYGAPCLYRPGVGVRLRNLLAGVFGFLPEFLKYPFGRNREWREAKRSGYGEVFKNAVHFDQADLLKDIKSPTLLIWGERDAEVPLAIAREMSQGIGRSALEILPGLGHNAHLENPNVFYGKVKKFIEGIE